MKPEDSKAKRFWRVVGKVTFWVVVLLGAWVISAYVEKETSFMVAFLVIVVIFNYEIQVIKEKIESINRRLDDIRQRGRTNDW